MTTRHTSLRFGLIAGVLVSIAMLAPILVLGPRPEYMKWGEITGYASMLLIMLAAPLAIRAERNRIGHVGFTRGLLIGCAVSVLAGLVFGAATWLFFLAQGDALPQAIYDFYRANAAGNPQQLAELERNRDWFFNLPLQAAVMFATVFLIGLAESLVGAWWFSRRPGRANVGARTTHGSAT